MSLARADPSDGGASRSGAAGEIDRLLDEVARGRLDASHEQLERITALADQLEQEGLPRQAIQQLERACDLLPEAVVVQLALAERYAARHDSRTALPLLHRLSDTDEAACRAHVLLGDHYRREADLNVALEHYEAVLARDLEYPRARSRADDLKLRLDRPRSAAAETILGAPDLCGHRRYLLQRELGRGGGGAVYLALDRELDRAVALKVLHPQVARQAHARTQLFSEARIAAALSHPQIVTIYDLDESLDLVVMEYCAGGTLADRIAAGPLEPERALRLVARVLEVLDVVHRCGVIHRDLKPANLLLRAADGGETELVLSDFGIAHALTDEDEPRFAGSRAYMAPEQRRGAHLDPRADLFSCGVILLELLLGRAALEPRQALRGVTPLDLHELWSELEQRLAGERGRASAPEVISLVRRLLSTDPTGRPAGAAVAAAEARQLVRRYRHAAAIGEALEQLRRRAGAAPSAEVIEWLRRSGRRLLDRGFHSPRTRSTP